MFESNNEFALKSPFKLNEVINLTKRTRKTVADFASAFSISLQNASQILKKVIKS